MSSELQKLSPMLLHDKWTLYHHFPSDNNWTLSGYNVLVTDIDSVEKVIDINTHLTDNIVKYSMLFYMRSHVSPLWEDPQNINGGCFSYKVINKYVIEVWRHLMFLVSGESLFLSPEENLYVNGITISPKKNFCIVKIWMKTNDLQDPSKITTIDYLTKNGVMFKKHG
jgi:hypothetical protein